MANIDRIVSVSIALKTAGVRQQSFSDLMIVGQHNAADRVSIITESDQLLTGYGLTDTSDLYRAAQVFFSQIPSPNRLFIGRRDSAEAINTTLAACAVANNNWYAFSEVSHVDSDLTLAAAWAEANTKLFLTALSDVDITSTTGAEPATALKTSNFFRTAWWYNIDPDQFPEVAAASRAFTILPGGETWANMRLSAVSAPPLTETAYINITAKNGNTFEPFENQVAITQNGITAGGERIDVIRFRDWLCEEIRTNTFSTFIDTRIPYTDSGIATIQQGIIKALDLGVRRGGIAPPIQDLTLNRIIPSYTVSVPKAATVSVNDRQARILRDVSFTAKLAGAIHAVEISGTLTYDNIG